MTNENHKTLTSLLFHTVRIIAGDKIDSKVFSFYKSHHFSEVANWLLVIKGSKFVLFVDLYYPWTPWSWVVKQSLIRNFDVLMAISASPSVSSGTYCNILQSRSVCIKEVFLAGGFFLNGQRTSFASEESHPQRKLKCIKCRTGLCSVWWSWLKLWIWPHRPVLSLDWNRPQVSFKLGFNAICSTIQEPGLAPGNASTVL